MHKEQFGGDKKVGKSILHKPERKLVGWLLPRVPKKIETYHLTLMTIPISVFIIIFSYLSIYDIRWLWGASLMIAFQWLTDSLDGTIGRKRNTGLIRWGYYMDHFLDYIFLAAVIIGYLFIIPEKYEFIKFFVFAIFVGFMINSYLSFAATNKFKISYLGIGPTEIRIIFIIINSLIILFGKTYLAGTLPYVLIFSFCGLCLVVYREQKEIWALDMNNKKEQG